MAESETQLAGFIQTAFGQYGELLERGDIVELAVRPSGAMWIYLIDGSVQRVGDLDSSARERIIRFCATARGVPVTTEAPIVSTSMPVTRYRFEGVLPPAAPAALFSIRFHAGVLYGMENYLADKVITQAQADYLIDAICARKNILISGGPGSGKTTFLKMLLGELLKRQQDQHLVVIEDTPEIWAVNEFTLPHVNATFLQTSETTDMIRLLASTLRQKPDRIIVGEVRDGAALAMVKAWNTGNPGGLASIHANSAAATLPRVESLVREVSASPLPDVIAEGLDLLAYIELTPEGRKLKEIIKVKGYKDEEFITEPVAI
jgi:type IV secretion system protein VirB11